MRVKHASPETIRPGDFDSTRSDHLDVLGRLRSLNRTLGRTEVSYRITVSLAILLFSPVLFEHLVRTIPDAWLHAAGLNSARSWLGMLLFLGVTPAVLGGVGYSAAKSERANRLTPELIAAARSRGDEMTGRELRVVAETLRAASHSRWCDCDVRRDASDEAQRLERLLESKCAFPIPAGVDSVTADNLPISAHDIGPA